MVTYRHILRVGLGAKFANKRSAGSLHPLEDSLFVELSIVHSLLLIEVLVENDRGLLHALGLGKGGVVGGSKQEVVALRLGERGETLARCLIVRAHVAHDHDLIHSLEIFQVIFADAGHGRHRLLGHVRNDSKAGDNRHRLVNDHSRVTSQL